ncbi:NAD(P)/FAD-dependent oxidoreductase [Paenibacillus herberti]|uniref:FAD dependent oxidoreductase n=1 Tax=Paenibacillus herberti TaxID=1619309 RepID=A0A229P4E7_9BACL|nr:hypothetical protein [Paenibacillus herberti]OXM17123.1 FAD dependent oxidoreductase [Paenibacillus herberti]
MYADSTSKELRSRAVVIGASIAGLLAAKTLSAHYEEIVLIERDELPLQPANRPGVPQDRHPHRLQDLGKNVLTELFPGWTDDLLAAGAYEREGKEMHLISPLAALQFPYDKDEGCSRPLLEWVIRHRVLEEPRIRLLQGREAAALLSARSGDQFAITGVRLKQSRGSTGDPQSPEDIMANLVVDASGRYSKLPVWLEQLGLGKPVIESLHARLAYSTRYYRIPEHLRDKYATVLIDGDPARAEGSGVFSPIENGLAETTIYGAGGKYPPVAPDQYEPAAAELIHPLLADILAQLEPVGDPQGFRVPECRWTHYESFAHWPSGLLVIGDAICNLDPIYGQGITVAAAEAAELGRVLAETADGSEADPSGSSWEQGLLHRFASIVLPAWWTIVVADLRWPGVTYDGPMSGRGISFCQTYLDIVRKQALQGGDMELFSLMMGVRGLDAAPSTLFGEEAVRSILIRCGREEWLEEVLDPGENLGQFLKLNLPFTA